MKEIDLKKIKKVYFIGIGGIGMSAVARMFLHEGKEVYGSDLNFSTLIAELGPLGTKVWIGDVRKLEPEELDLVVYTVAIPNDHPQLLEAQKRNIPTITYPESLGLISQDKFTIAVAGTHGKTTTTAMIAQILIGAGFDPTVIVGSLLKESHSNFIPGKSKYLVVEACEYKRSFLNIKPDIAVITNIDDDHLDYYKDFAGVVKGFKEFVEGIKPDGTLVTDSHNEKIKPILGGLKTEVRDFIAVTEKIAPGVPGLHNIKNAKAAFLVSEILGVPKEKALAALKKFSGTWRRFEEKGKTKSGAFVYDDYGHHPSEIKATLQAAREKFPDSKIFLAFQPHLYSRTKEHIEEFGPAMAGADEILILPIYAAREPKDDSVSSEILVEKIKKTGASAQFYKDFASAGEYLKKELKSGDVLFTMGAGDISTLAEIVLKK